MKRTSITMRTLFGWIVACSSILTIGCDDFAKVALKGTIAKVGATVVDNSSDETVRLMFEQADAACPQRMDVYTTLESVTMIDERRVEFHYRVNNEGKNLARRFDKDVLKRAAVNHMKGNPMAVAIAKRDLSIEHIYEDAFGGHLLSFTINKAVLAGNLYPTGEQRSNPFDVKTVKAQPADQVQVKSAGPMKAPMKAPVKAPVKASVKARQDVASSKAKPVQRKSTPAVIHRPSPPAEVPQPMLPQPFKPRRTKDNPAGVQQNPFIGASR